MSEFKELADMLGLNLRRDARGRHTSDETRELHSVWRDATEAQRTQMLAAAGTVRSRDEAHKLVREILATAKGR